MSWWNYFSSAPSWHWLNWRKTQFSDLHSISMQQKLRHKHLISSQRTRKRGSCKQKGVGGNHFFSFYLFFFSSSAAPRSATVKKVQWVATVKWQTGKPCPKREPFFPFSRGARKRPLLSKVGCVCEIFLSVFYCCFDLRTTTVLGQKVVLTLEESPVFKACL